MNAKKILKILTDVILDELERNPNFAQRLVDALGETDLSMNNNTMESKLKKKSRSRDPAVIDPMAILAERGEDTLRLELKSLDIRKLLDIVAEFAMDPSKLVMKWKNSDRIIEHIIESARRRVVKGDAFRI